MAGMKAYLDDFGIMTIWISSTFYQGRSDSFTLLSDHGYAEGLPIRQVEQVYNGTIYTVSAPFDIEFGKGYKVRESHGLTVPMINRLIVTTVKFNEMFFYEGEDLGATYHRMHTDFAVWAPTAVNVILRLRVNGKLYAYPMERTDRGVYRKSVIGDMKNATYVYLVERNGEVAICTDPYAYSSTANSIESAVIDLERVTAVPKVAPKGECTGTDAIIYEVSVRDATSSMVTGTQEHGTFNALTEDGTTFHGMPTGLNHIKSLGVTHVQLLPVMDFATVEEYHPKNSYNWGYDPEHYLSPEGSYSSDPDDPYARMIELRRLIAVLHQNDLRVNLDVVFNHMYETDSNNFQSIVPYYYFRYNKNGNNSNGSYCGNDFASNQPMARLFIVQTICKIIDLYDIDGLRFDLMGIIDITTMNTIRDAVLAMKDNMMIYGEGWDMPTTLEWERKAQMINQQRMPHIGHFNDYFRDVIKGKTGDDQRYVKGYATGDHGNSFGALSALAANVMDAPYFKRFETPDQSINGLETHDNATLWDKMHFCCGNEDRETRRRRQRMMLGMTMVAQGIPFLHAGIEFCGTKNDNTNSYNAGDSINQLDWERAEFNKETIDYTRRAIALRRKYKAFRLKDTASIFRSLDLKTVDGGILFYDINLEDEETGTKQIRVVINATYDDKWYTFDPGYTMIFDDMGRNPEMKGTSFRIPRLSMAVFTK